MRRLFTAARYTLSAPLWVAGMAAFVTGFALLSLAMAACGLLPDDDRSDNA